MKGIFYKKPITQMDEGLLPHQHLKRCLTAFDLSLLGIGAIIGAGIFILTGLAAATKAGPAIVVSFILAGSACGFSALSYAELASSIGGCGSAYGYAYAGFGEIFAWIIGWDLILEYAVSCAAVAIGWSAYFAKLVNILGWVIPQKFLSSFLVGGFVDIPAFVIMMFLALLLILGIKNSARVNAAIVLVKLVTITVFIAVSVPYVDFHQWANFMPFGWKGIMGGAAMIFFAYIGFDAVSTAAEEAVDPKRDLPLGIINSLMICTVIYVLVAGLLTLVMPYSSLNTASPVADVLVRLGHASAASLISVGALAGLTTVILVMFYGLSRVAYAMSRDNLLPKAWMHLNTRFHTPMRILVVAGILISLIAATMPIGDIAELVNIGTLAAFTMVNLGVIVLRYAQPDLPRPFKTPLGISLPILGIAFCVYLMLSLPWITWLRFLVWMVLGLGFYGAKVFHSSRVS
ncbi:MAG: amino acid permease [Gammaproteobacteria bacterium]|nr:amino acid permease [Gammaproteobacteria bacterium]